MRDRAILTKFLTRGISPQSSESNFRNIFVSPKMAAIMNFLQKLQKTKMLVSLKPCEIERFRQKFLAIGYICRVGNPILKKVFVSPKMVAIFIFRIFCKIAKHKNT